MTLDAELRERLHAVAEHVPIGEPEVRRFVRRGRRRARTKVFGIAASVVVLLAGAGILGSYVMRPPELHSFANVENAIGGLGRERTDRPASGQEPVFGAVEYSSDNVTVQSADEFSALASPAPAPVTGPAAEPQAAGEISGVGPKIVKTGTVEVEVREGEFSRRFSEIERIAARYDGFITASGTSGEDARSGEKTIRVPEESFEDALADIKELGSLRAESVRGEDVTAEFVDLEARLRIFRVRERFLFRRFRAAETLGDSLRLQRMLEDVQLDIERLRGQIRLLRDQTSYGTIDVAMYEVGIAPPGPGDPGAGPLAGAWSRAWHGFQTVLAAIVIGLGYLLPVLVLLVLLWVGVRQVRARTA